MRRARKTLPAQEVTIHDLARAVGVSTATVSRALRNLPGVSAETRQSVLAAAAQLDYVVSPNASRLSSGRSGTIAVIVPYISRWYFAGVVAAVEHVLQAADLDLLLLVVGEPDGARPSEPVRKLRRRVDGLLVVALSSEDPRVQEAVQLQLPTVLVGLTAPGAASVRVDDAAGEETATRHLLNLGHRRIGLISGAADRPPFAAERARLEGYQRALAAAGLEPSPELMLPGEFTVAGGESAMAHLLALPEPPTAVVAMSDEMAFGAIRAVRRHRLRVGEDVSVVGFDGHDLAEVFDLTTMVQPLDDLGRIAGMRMLELSSGPQPLDDQVLPTRLVVRGSTGPGHRHARRPA